MQLRIVLLILPLSYALISNSMASQLRWSFGTNYNLSGLSVTDLSDATITLNSTLSYSAATSLDFEFGSGETYYFLGVYTLYQSTRYDVSLTPEISDIALNALGTGFQAGIAFWLIKLGVFAQAQDIFVLAHDGEFFSLTKSQVKEFGGKLDFTFLSRSDWDFIFKARYAMIPETRSILSGSELATGLYLEHGSHARWTFGAGLRNLDYSTLSGSNASQDFLFGVTFTVPIPLTPLNRTSKEQPQSERAK